MFFFDGVVCDGLGTPFGGPRPRPLGARTTAGAEAAGTALDTSGIGGNPTAAGVSRDRWEQRGRCCPRAGPACLAGRVGVFSGNDGSTGAERPEEVAVPWYPRYRCIVHIGGQLSWPGGDAARRTGRGAAHLGAVLLFCG